MTATYIQSPYEIFTDTSGSPLQNGYIYIGTANLNPETNPITVYWDSALSIPAAQPIRTLNGYPSRNGSPDRIYSNVGDYSITVKNAAGVQVFNSLVTTGLISSDLVTVSDGAAGSIWTTVAGFVAKIISSTGSSVVGFIQTGIGAVAGSVQGMLRNEINVWQFMTDAQRADILLATPLLEHTSAVQAALNSVSNSASIELIFPAGHFRLNELYTYTAGAAGFAGNGNITLRGMGHPSVTGIRANSFIKGTVLEFINTTGNCLNVSGATQAQNIQIENMLVTGNTTGYVVYGEYTPTIKMRNTYITNQNATGGGVSLAQCWYADIGDGSWIEFTGAGTSSGKGFTIASSAISGGLVGLTGKSAIWNWGVNLSVEASGFSLVSIDDSECAGGVTSNISITQPLDSFEVSRGYFEGSAPLLIATQSIKNLKIDSLYINAGSTASGDARARMQLSALQTGQVSNVYCFRPWSNLIEVGGESTSLRSNLEVSHISYIHDTTSALTKNITGCANNGSGLIRVTIVGHGYITGRRVNIASVVGTTEANGEWGITVIDADTFDLVGSTFANPYVSGGTSTLLCYVLKQTNGFVVANISDITFSGGTADLDATGALRLIDSSVNGSVNYTSRAGVMPSVLAMDIVDAAAGGTGISLSGVAYKHYRYTTSAATVITVSVPAITASAMDGAMFMISNLPASTERLQIRKTDGGTVTYGYLAPGETCIMQYERTGQTLILRKLQPEGAPSTVYGTAAPVGGTWRVGDRLINSAPAVGQPKAWSCTVAGTPGTWVSEGNL